MNQQHSIEAILALLVVAAVAVLFGAQFFWNLNIWINEQIVAQLTPLAAPSMAVCECEWQELPRNALIRD